MRTAIIFLATALVAISFVATTLAQTTPLAQTSPPFTSVAFSPDGQELVVGSQAGVQVFSWPELVPGRRISSELVQVNDIVFSPDGRKLLVSGGAPAEYGACELLAWPEGKRLSRLGGHSDLVYRAAWSPDGQRIVTASGDATCRVFFVQPNSQANQDEPVIIDKKLIDEEIVYQGHSRPVLAVCFMPDGKSVCSAGVDHTIRHWDSLTGSHLRTLDNHLATVNELVMLSKPSSMLISISDDRTVRLWQPSIGRMVRFVRLPEAAQAIALSPKSGRLYVASGDATLHAIDPESMTILPRTDHEAKTAGDQKAVIYALAVAVDDKGTKQEPIVIAGRGLRVQNYDLMPASNSTR